MHALICVWECVYIRECVYVKKRGCVIVRERVYFSKRETECVFGCMRECINLRPKAMEPCFDVLEEISMQPNPNNLADHKRAVHKESNSGDQQQLRGLVCVDVCVC